ncbi:MAG: helix-turn-helix transcriptional regulator [Brevundimonas sp.]|uniref:helix-turn-helix domain-containing protein n=1 Tax=Brevundimonas sp. TaxID=1871086 RepID=UPI002637CBCD|nr:helix-turn-helix transcriptional regulator [Brevundimonas sp.]MDI6624710.1 helix-turn-helix transcriptional regulator [Brevundimonas sp.]MDQ7811342.1 helix-turn-helix transcriptional regulator [Brevundimonas sp.]
MITGAQLRAARALLGMDQRELAERAGLSVPTIQRMEGSDGSVRAVVDSLEKVMDALTDAGVEMIADGALTQGVGRGVRLLNRRAKERTYEAGREAERAGATRTTSGSA